MKLPNRFMPGGNAVTARELAVERTGVFPRLGRKPNATPTPDTEAGLVPSLVRGYGRLVLAPKDPRARTFTGRMERLAREAEEMTADPAFLARARERADAEIEEFADAQRREIERTVGTLEDGLRRTANRLEDT
ncbi:hypothetical protein EON77_05815, partial [bacterium]